MKGKVKNPKGLEKIVQLSKRLKGVKGVALVLIDGRLKLMPRISAERMRLTGKNVKIIAVANHAYEFFH